MRKPMRSDRRITNRLMLSNVIAEFSPPRGSNVNASIALPAAVTCAAGSLLNVTSRPASVNTPRRFGARAGRRISLAGSLPAVFCPSCSQNNPCTASQPFGAVSSAMRSRRYLAISARYAAEGSTSAAIASSSRTRIGNDLVPFVGARARDDGDDRFGVAQVEHFVWNAGCDEDEITGVVVDALGQPLPVLVADAALEDVEHDFEIHVDVRPGDAARRDRRHVHRQLRRADVLS